MSKEYRLKKSELKNSILDLVSKLLIDLPKSTDGNQRRQLKKEIQSWMMMF